MNCKPGDLAVIVKGDGFDIHLVGTVVRVVRISQYEPNVCCAYEGPRLHTVFGEVIGLSDDCLQPIRPPGEPVDVRKEEEAPV